MSKEISPNLELLGGQSVIVVFFGSWCGPCVSEFPSLFRFMKEVNSSQFILVAEDDNESSVRDFLRPYGALGVNVRLIFDNDKSYAEHFAVERLPESLVLKNGRLCDRLVGEQDWSSKSVRSRVFRLLSSDELCH